MGIFILMNPIYSLHLVYIPVTGVGLYQGFRGRDWYEYRIEIFKNYTLNSLAQQTTKDWVLWLSFRPEELKDPLTGGLARYLDERGFDYVMTFDGLMYHDDKFSRGTTYRLYNFGRIVRDCYRKRRLNGLWQGMKELFRDKNKTLPRRLAKSLATMKANLPKANVIYVTRIDSDDMFHKDALALIQNQPPFDGVYSFQNGYVFNRATQELAYWQPKKHPPFHTIVWQSDNFYDHKKHLAYYGDFKSHEDVPKVWENKRLKEGMYCVLVHNQGKQISTIWNHPFKGKEITENKKEILANFGIDNRS